MIETGIELPTFDQMVKGVDLTRFEKFKQLATESSRIKSIQGGQKREFRKRLSEIKSVQ
jgi:hypothetical protein